MHGSLALRPSANTNTKSQTVPSLAWSSGFLWLRRWRYFGFQSISNSTAAFTCIPTSRCFTSSSMCSTAPTATRLMGRKVAYFSFCDTSESSHLPVEQSYITLLLQPHLFTILHCHQGLLHTTWILYSALCRMLMVFSSEK